MKTVILASGVVIAALLAGPALAQNDKPGEARAQPSTPHTKEERKAARSTRRTTGKSVARQGGGQLDVDPGPKPGSATPASKSDRAAARGERREAGTQATQNPPPPSGPN